MERLPEQIETERLVLRVWQPDGAAALNAAVTTSIEHLRPWMPWIVFEPLSVDDRRNLIIGWRSAWEDGGDAVYGILAGDTVVGGAGLHRRGPDHSLEIGYWTHVDQVGKGYMTEAAAALTATALGIDGIARVDVHHDRANEISGRIPARLGYQRMREVPTAIEAPAEVGIEVQWEITAAQWAATEWSGG